MSDESTNVMRLPTPKKERPPLKSAARDFERLGEMEMAYPIYIAKSDDPECLIPMVHVGSKQYVVLLDWVRIVDASKAFAIDLEKYSIPPKSEISMTSCVQQMITGLQNDFEFFSVLTYTTAGCERKVVLDYDIFEKMVQRWIDLGDSLRGRHFTATNARYNLLRNICEYTLWGTVEEDDHLRRIAGSGGFPAGNRAALLAL